MRAELWSWSLLYALGPEGDSARVSQETGDWVGMEADLGGTVSSSDT